MKSNLSFKTQAFLCGAFIGEYTLAELAYMERRIKSAARRLGVTLGGKPAIS